MLKIIAIAAIVLVVVVAGILVFAATKPDSFSIARTIAIKAPPEKIYPLIDDFGNWGAWSPYEKLDPDMKRTFGERSAGKGAVYEWDGDGNVGAGRIEIVEATPPSKVAITLDMSKPMEAHNLVEFTLVPKGETTDVTWAMQGNSPYLAKLMQVFMSMDRMVGSQFEQGLADLKAAAEK